MSRLSLGLADNIGYFDQVSYSSLLILALTWAICLYLLIVSKRAGLSHISGPWIARYTDAWALYNGWKILRARRLGLPLTKLGWHKQLQARYGDVVRIGPRTVVCFDAMAVPTIYAIRSRLEKSDSYVPFRQPGVTTSLLSIPDEATHSKYRKVVANAYSMSSIKNYEPYVDEMVQRFTAVCADHAKREEPLNLTMWSYYYCYDVVSKVTLGTSLGFMDGEGQDAHSLIKNVKSFGMRAGLMAPMPWLHYILNDNIIMRWYRPSPFYRVVQEPVKNRMQHPDPREKRPDLLSHFIATHTTQPDLMDEKQITISASGNLIAGGLSPGQTFDTLCRFLLKSPDTQNSLHTELKAANIPTPAPYDSIKSLPYLEGVIREAERLHQSSSFSLERVAPSGGLDLPNGIHLPQGTKVGCASGVINIDPQVYGQDAAEYRPQRWIKRADESDEQYELRRNLMDRTGLTFGQGSRTCIGKNIFRLEVFKVIAAAMKQFRFEAVSSPSKGDLYVKVLKHGN